MYFLSVLCNGLSGYILFSGDENGTDDSHVNYFNNPTFHLVLGILSAVTGILKLLSPSIGGILILGDLIPAAAGVIAGFMLIFGIYRKDTSMNIESTGTMDILGASLLRFRRSIGLGLLAVSLIHFLFPQALFL